jgi:hypothetical protein
MPDSLMLRSLIVGAWRCQAPLQLLKDHAAAPARKRPSRR